MADTELINSKTGIDVWFGTGDGSDKGTAYYVEPLCHMPMIWPGQVVYLKSDTQIHMAHNARNIQNRHSKDGGRGLLVGIFGKDGLADSGDEGIIRYKIDRDRQYQKVWVDQLQNNAANLLPAYTGPWTFGTQEFEPGVPVVGTTGPNGGAVSSMSARYWRGLVDAFGDEWHVLSYADDDNVPARIWNAAQPNGDNFHDYAFWAGDGHGFEVVVNPKTPCIHPRVTGTGQFYTNPPKAYWTPKLCEMITRFAPGSAGTVTFELRDIYGRAISYRINGGSWVNTGLSSVTLTDSQFQDGNNTLEYYSAGFQANTKTRVLVKNPVHPSKAEAHGHHLWSPAEFGNVLAKRTHAQFSSYYNLMKTRSDSFSYRDAWDSRAGLGYRTAAGAVLWHTFLAMAEGWTATPSGKTKTYGQYAKEQVLENFRCIHPLGFEMQHSSDPLPNRELHYRGYYDTAPVIRAAYAYDLMVANFRDEQVAGGITAIEDYFVRDRLASLAFEGMQWAAGMCVLGEPGMWGVCRMWAGIEIGLIMPEYSTPYYGTSGFGTVQTTYPMCPFEGVEYTWKGAFLNHGNARTAYPQLRWTPSVGEGDTLTGLFTPAGFYANATLTLSYGDWIDKNSYTSLPLMGFHMQVLANAMARNGLPMEGKFRTGLSRLAAGTCVAGKYNNGEVQGLPFGTPLPLLMNSTFPDLVTSHFSALQQGNVAGMMGDLDVFAYAFYDPNAGQNTPIPPSIVQSPRNTSSVIGEPATFSVTVTGSSPFSYQWYKDGALIVGATSATYTISSTVSTDAAAYHVVVSNAYGSATSSPGALTLTSPGSVPTVHTPPQSQTRYVGQTAVFFCGANGTGPLTYQWRKNGVDIPGAASDTFTIESVQMSDADVYTCRIVNAYGNLVSQGATLTVSHDAGGGPITAGRLVVHVDKLVAASGKACVAAGISV